MDMGVSVFSRFGNRIILWLCHIPPENTFDFTRCIHRDLILPAFLAFLDQPSAKRKVYG